MATSVYFNNQNATREQFLVEDLIIESIRNHGIDVYYIPRTTRANTDDKLFGDDPVKTYDRAIKIDMYMETFNDFEGQQEFFSKFGLQIDKTARLAVARRTFERFVGTALRNLPKEGDLVYLPIQQKILEIRFVEEEKNFFQLGKPSPYMFVLSMETFKYNGELLQTGISEIDNIGNLVAQSVIINLTDVGSANSYIVDEIVYSGTDLANANAVAYVADFNLPALQLRVRNIRGVFANGANIIGSSSNADFVVGANYDMRENASTDYEDNMRVEVESNTFLDFTESNPFGEP